MYAIIDIETTGLNSKSDRITEIAIILYDGEKIVDQYETLINPERHISYYITGLTGISNKMVADAPRFYEVAKKIVEMTEDAIFVAHNASFDYNFIRSEFKRLFFEYKRKTLCTKKLSRKLMPGLKSYGLGSLSKYLKIDNKARHRAGGDALATVCLLEHLLSIEKHPEEISLRGLNSNLPEEMIMNLPEEPGVYYFFDEKEELLYVGKSVNIKQRVISHLNNNLTKRAIEMKERISQIHYELTGSELVAQLLESFEIKRLKPPYNRAQRRTIFNHGLFMYTASDGYVRLSIEKIRKDKLPLTSYASAQEGRDHLIRLIAEHELCQRFCGIYKTDGACFHQQIGQCKGACKGMEPPDEYNDRVIDAISKYIYKNKNFFIIDDGRTDDEVSVIKVENGKYIGYGYTNIDNVDQNADILHDIIKPLNDNKDIQVIIRGYLRKNNFEKVVIY